MRGGYEDVFPLDFGEWRFPLGTASVSSLWVYTWGKTRSKLRGGYGIAAVGAPMSAVPQFSQFWHSDGTNGSKILTWHNFFLGRVPLSVSSVCSVVPISAQLELFPNGDYIARSNLVERAYKRINPDDRDDDGIPNDIDANPEVNDGENFGPSPDLPDGANAGNYCWVEVAVSNANSLVDFVGDKSSNLPDPRFVAKAGTSHRVNLLIGKTYRVTSAQPIVCTAKLSEEISVDQDDERTMTIVYPVSYEIVDNARSISRQVRMVPPITGTIQWDTNSCPCHAQTSGAGYDLPMCNGACSCYSCAPGGFTFHYEGYSLSFGGVECDCNPYANDVEDDGPYAASASVSFSKSAVIFEDEYMNTPTESVPRRSTSTTLTCTAHGGPNGGRAIFTLGNAEKLICKSGVTLPIEVDVPAGHKVSFEIVYEGAHPSESENDVVATAQFVDNEEGNLGGVEDALTVVEVELSPVNSINECYNRHKWGICEKVLLEWSPAVEGLSFTIAGDGVVDLGRSGETFVYLDCPTIQMSDILSIDYRDVSYSVLSQVFAPSMIVARNPKELKFDIAYGYPGGVGMQMDLYILPDTVSFQWLSFMEEPSMESVVDGYFTNNVFSSVWYHTEDRGAGEWHDIKPENFFFTDVAMMGDQLILPWSEGRIYWNIPIKGKRKRDDRIVVDDTINYGQEFSMNADGRLRISKLGFWVQRNPYNERTRASGVKRWDE